ncbi:MAG: hypothetical protein WC842_02305 [Candidatus Paceibacterota bacterium]
MKKFFLLVIVFSSLGFTQPELKTRADSVFYAVGMRVKSALELKMQSVQKEYLHILAQVVVDGVVSRSDLFDVEAKKYEFESAKEAAQEKLNFYGQKIEVLGWQPEDVAIWKAIDSLDNVLIFDVYFPDSAIKNLQKALVVRYEKPVTVSFYAQLSSLVLYGILLIVSAILFYFIDANDISKFVFALGILLLLSAGFCFIFS